MFKIGDKVVYPMHGAGTIESIEEKEILNKDEDGVGEIYVKAPYVMLGYYQNEEATKDVIKDGWFHTGDLAKIDEDGYIFIMGRKKSVNALLEAQENFDSHVFLVAQKELTLEDPKMEDLYEMGTLCTIEHVRNMDGYKRVKFKGLERAKLNDLTITDKMVYGTITPVVDIHQDDMEEMALVRKIAKQLEENGATIYYGNQHI